MNIEEKMQSSVKEVHRFLNEIDYDHDAITYDENGKILKVTNKIPSEVVESRKSTCMGGVFYSARELREYFGEEMLFICSCVQKDDFTFFRQFFHGMYLFNLGGFYGAISKSQEDSLNFIEPTFISLSSLVSSPQILRGYNNLAESRGEKLLGMGFLTGGIREIFPNYEFDVTQIPVEGIWESIRWIYFDDIVKENLKSV